MTLLLLIGCVRTAPDKQPETDTGADTSVPDSGDTDSDTDTDADTDTDTDTEGTRDTGPIDALRELSSADIYIPGTRTSGVPMPAVGGDLDGDGAADLAVSAGGYADVGRVCLFHGLAPGQTLDLETCPDRIVGSGGSDRVSLLEVADVDGDGQDDALLSRLGDVLYSRGSVVLLLGPLTGETSVDDASLSVSGTDDDDYFAWAEDEFRIGDMDDDGAMDLIVPSIGLHPGGHDYEREAVSLVPLSWTGDHSSSEVGTWIAWSGADDASFGFSPVVADVTGDGTDDLWVSAPNTVDGGRAYLFVGPLSPGGLTEGDADITLTAAAAGADLGEPMAVADLDLDGSDELILGAPVDDTRGSAAGALYVEHGGDIATGSVAGAGMIVYAGGIDEELGLHLAVGDVDGDGVVDVLTDRRDATRGAVYRIGGWVSGTSTITDFPALIEGDDAGDYARPAAVFDVDADGVEDIVVKGEDLEGGSVSVFLGGWL